MTAETAGKAAVEGVGTTLRRLRDQWLVLAFFAGTLFWARDTWDEFAALPALMREQVAGLAAVERRLGRIETAVAHPRPDRSPVLGLPGGGHAIGDAAPGAWTMLRWRPVEGLRGDCVAEALDAWMVDAAGAWFTVETSLAPMPVLEGEADFAFRVRVHPRMAPGRAWALVHVVFDCGTHRQVETAPRLQFRVLD